jgi:hypothetical protein
MEFNEVKMGLSKEMPAKMVVFGVPKIGKSRFAAQFPDAFFINVEDGLQYLGKEVRSTPALHSFDEVLGWLKHIHDAESFKAGRLVIDSLDWVESLAKDKVEKEHGAPLSDRAHKAYAYGAGQAMVDDAVMRVFRGLDAIYKKKGIPSLLIAHSVIKTIDLPTKDPYSKYELKMSKATAAKATEWADLVLFADYSFAVTKDGKTSEPRPVFLAGGSAAYTGGGRMLLNKEIPLSYDHLIKEITR